MLSRRLAAAMALCVVIQGPGQAHAICRVVEPVELRGGVHFDPNTLALYVYAPDQVVDHECVDRADAGLPSAEDGTGDPTDTMDMDDTVDANDGGTDLDMDADGGALDGDEDAGVSADDGSWPPDVEAGASCPPGFVSIPIEASVVHMVVQPAVLTTGGRAGLVMPVPTRPDIHAANRDIFEAVRELLQPRIKHVTEYVEDPALGDTCSDPKGGGGGCGDDGDTRYEDDYTPGRPGDTDNEFYDGDVEDAPLEEVTVGDEVVRFAEALSTPDYDVTVLSASSADALEEWMDLNGFAHDADDDAAFAAYVDEGAWFVALEVHPESSGAMSRPLAPIVVSFRSSQIPILHRLQYHPAGGELVTEAFVLAPNRMRAADSSAEVLYAAPVGFGGDLAGFGLADGWLTQLRFTRQMDVVLEDSAMRTAPNSELRPQEERIQVIRVPTSDCEVVDDEGSGCSSDSEREDDGGGCSCGGGGGCICSVERGPGALGAFANNLAPGLLACLWLAIRRRRRRRR